MLSFYTLPSTIIGNPTYKTLKAAFMYYTVARETPLQQLMTDALILAAKTRVLNHPLCLEPVSESLQSQAAIHEQCSVMQIPGRSCSGLA